MNFDQLINHFIDYFHQLSLVQNFLPASLLLSRSPPTAVATPCSDLRRHNLSPYFRSTEKDRK